MLKRLLIILVISASGLIGSAQKWFPDTLGGRFEMRYVDQGIADGLRLRSTIVRLLCEQPTDRGVLYIHGFNDYFFQTEMAERFVAKGYDFYAVDLRRYGRSTQKGDKQFSVRDLREYFPDIDSALVAMKHQGIKEIVLMGHSTGGLITSYYMALNPKVPVDALVLNSPFLDWNLGGMEKFVGVVSAVGKVFPNIPISTGDGSAYSESLMKSRRGEWSYITDWKHNTPVKVDAGWIRAINEAQKYLKKHPDGIHVPILLMFSDKSYHGNDWSPEASRADAVLDVNDILRYGSKLGPDVTSVRVNGGLHDLVLSAPNIRNSLYKYIFSWLSKTLPK